jgi:D-glycero-D-manno-heptose 1,7-bisphosphate phosphatase
MILKKEFLNMLSNKNLNLSYYLKKISNKKKISGFKTHNNYLSISDLVRLKETRKFFKKKRYILIDRDGVINKKNPNFFYVRNTKELFFNEKIISVLQKFPKFKFICITNQAGIATGEVLKKNLNKINLKIKNYLKKKSINLIKFYVSEHHYNSNSFFRKPNPGNFIKAATEYKILLDKTFYIGDDLRDVEAAYRANTKCFYVGDKKKINKKFNNIITGNLQEALLRYY